MKARDLTGLRFGRLAVMSFAGVSRAPSGRTRRIWTVRCDCGELKSVQAASLLSGNTTSCGCAHREQLSARSRTHGACVGGKTVEYKTWEQVWKRCTNPRTAKYPNYGGRGITVCDRWKSFENFLADMGRRPSSKHSIDRINNDGNYEPGNCRWVTNAEQSRNRRSNVVVEHDGESMTATAWAERLGIRPGTLLTRLRRGWTPSRALGLEQGASA